MVQVHKLQECKLDYECFLTRSYITDIPVGTCKVRAYSQVFIYWASYARTPTFHMIGNRVKRRTNGYKAVFLLLKRVYNDDILF